MTFNSSGTSPSEAVYKNRLHVLAVIAMATTAASTEERDEELARTMPLKDSDAIQKLEHATINLVSLGEWEAAKGHIKVLANGQPDQRRRSKQILTALVLNAQDYW